MANTYKDLEDAVLARLNPLVAEGVELEAMPETDADYSEPFAAPRVSVSYQHSEFSDQIARGHPNMLTSSVMAQDEYAEIHIILRSRTIRTDDEIKGVYWLHKEVTSLLYGFQPENWGRLFPKTFDYLAHRNGTWVYGLVLTCRRIAVQAVTDDDDITYPVLEQVDFNTNLE